jgi:hypothetical protein
MAISQETLRLVADVRRQVDRLADGPTRSLTLAWLQAWNTLSVEFAAALDELVRIGGDRWPTRRQIQEAARLQQTLDATGRALERLAAQAQQEIDAAARAAAGLGEAAQHSLVESQLPHGSRIQYSRADEQQFAAMVNRTSETIHKVTWPLSQAAVDAMKTELVRGISLGDNPVTVARAMLRRLEGAFNGGLARAVNICRTEVLDSHRDAAMLSQLANSDVLQGWMWTATLQRNTCPSCWSKHGSIHPLDEPGPNDHQSGRCSRTPVTKPWRELGFTSPEPPSVIPDAQTVFRQLPRADQLAIMGPARLRLLNSGDIAWDDLSQLRTTSGWRDSWTVRPVKDLQPA